MSEAKALPEALKEETPTTKLLYLYLLNRGELAMTHQAIANALYTERYLITKAINRLELLGLIVVLGTGYKKRLTIKP
jgi:DNA-binding MarR family transcriptional regulator